MRLTCVRVCVCERERETQKEKKRSWQVLSLKWNVQFVMEFLLDLGKDESVSTCENPFLVCEVYFRFNIENVFLLVEK